MQSKRHYRLRYFDQPALELDGQAILKGLSRPMQVLTYVAYHHSGVESNKLCSVLWPRADRSAQTRSLKQAVYQVRRVAPSLLSRKGMIIVADSQIVSLETAELDDAIARGDIDFVLQYTGRLCLPDAEQGGLPFEHWAAALRATYAQKVNRYLRAAFRDRLSSGDPVTVLRWYQELRSRQLLDPALIAMGVRAQLHASVQPIPWRHIRQDIEVCKRLDPDRGERLATLAKRGTKWDRSAGAHPGPFCGRLQVVASYRTALREVKQSTGAIYTVSGPIGVGRSRCLRQLGRVAAIQGARVQLTRMIPGQAHLNYSRLVRSLLRLAGAREMRQYARASTAEILLRLKAQDEACAVLLADDIDGAGESCMELLREIAGALHNTPLLMALTAKDTSVIQAVLDGVPRGVPATSVQLSTLTREERAPFLLWLRQAFALSDDDVAVVDGVSQGNPRYAIACARSARAQTSSPLSALIEELRSTVHQLSPRAERVLLSIVMAGGQLDVRAIAAALRLSVDVLSMDIAWLCDLGALKRTGTQVVEVSDQYFCEALIEKYTQQQKEEIAATLFRSVSRYSWLGAARLAEVAGAFEEAARYYIAAGRQALKVRALEDAASLFDRATTIAPTPELIARGRYWQAELSFLRRRLPEAAAQYRSVLSSAGTLSRSMLALTSVRHAQVTAMLDPEVRVSALELLHRVRYKVLRRHSPRAAGEVLLAMSNVAVLDGSSTSLSVVADLLSREVHQRPSHRKWFDLAAAQCKLSLLSAGYVAALPQSGRYLANARISGNAQQITTSLVVRAVVLTAAGDLPEAERHYREADAIVHEHGLLGFSHILQMNYAVALLEMGDTDVAISMLMSLREIDQVIGAPYYVAFDDLNLATAYYEAGDYASADNYAAQTLARASAFPRKEHGAALAIRALIAGKRGNWQDFSRYCKHATTLRQSGGDLSYLAMAQAAHTARAFQPKSAADTLLENATVLHAKYRPGALRLRLFAAEIIRDVDPAAARKMAERCATDALRAGMFGLASRSVELMS